MFTDIMKVGLKNIEMNHSADQKSYIDAICKRVRHMEPDIIYKADAFFVPNQDYMRLVFGPEITLPEYDVYDEDGYCDWDGYLVFPMYDILDDIVGLVGFNPINKLKAKEEEFWDLSYYKHSSKRLMDKSAHLFAIKGALRRALEEGYIVITDGVFDMLSGAQEGIITGALLGSSLNQKLIAMLRLIDVVILAKDNDEAGLRVLRVMRKQMPNLRTVNQGEFKDLDDLLKSKHKDRFLKELKNNINCKINLDIEV